MFETRPLRPAMAALLVLLAHGGHAEPWRVQDKWDLPNWLTVSGDHQLRYEWMDNTFRTVDPGSDNLLLSRILIAAEARLSDSFRVGAELQDARTWGAESGTPLSNTFVNALEPLQLYAGFTARDLLAKGDQIDLRVGRFTMQMGSNRFVARHIFRNTLQSHTGANVIWSQSDGPRLQFFLTNPVIRRPADSDGLRDNDVKLDQDSRTLFWGAHLDQFEFGGHDAAVYVFGIDDSDSSERPTLNRNYVTTGFRLLGEQNDWYWEVEGAYQFGSVRD